ncbi:MAG: hypothetical protein H7Y07_02855 [Pyrinomonadaceae bacterium]|nr:hypothetical protein [Sphingobacteriaceae bacterium]
MNRYIFLLSTLICVFTGCKPDSPLNIPEGFDPNSPVTYQPTIKNFTWSYSLSFAGKSIPYTRIMNGKAATINGNTLFEATVSPASSPSEKVYFGSSNHIYRFRNDGLPNGAEIDLEYLNDTAKVKYSWEKGIIDPESNAVVGKSITTIKETGITKEVKGVKYRDVIHTEVKTQYITGRDTFTDMTTYDFYIARAVGIIQLDTKNHLGGESLNTSLQLEKYFVK